MRSSRRHAASTQQAADAVHAERAKLAHWEAEEAAARAELASLQDRAGAEVLDNPDAATSLSRHMQELRDRADIAQRAAAAQQPRVQAAERAYLLAEAEVLEEPIKRLQAQLDRHQARTAELLKVLEEHEGRFVPENELLEEQWQNGGRVQSGGSRRITLLTSQVLAEQIEAARRPVLVLQELAEGRDPGQHPELHGLVPEEFYPACVWGPDAVVPAPAYQRALGSRASQLEALRASTIPAARQRVAEAEAELEEAKAAGDTRQTTLRSGPATWSGPTLADKLKAAQDHLEKALADESRMAAEVAALTGVSGG